MRGSKSQPSAYSLAYHGGKSPDILLAADIGSTIARPCSRQSVEEILVPALRYPYPRQGQCRCFIDTVWTAKWVASWVDAGAEAGDCRHSARQRAARRVRVVERAQRRAGQGRQGPAGAEGRPGAVTGRCSAGATVAQCPGLGTSDLRQALLRPSGRPANSPGCCGRGDEARPWGVRVRLLSNTSLDESGHYTVVLICQGMSWQHLHQVCAAGKV